MRRLIIRRDGTVEKDEVVPAEALAAVAACASTGLSQAEFAKLLGVSKRTLQEWEQGRKQPTGAAKSLLKIALKHPIILREMLTA
ncbi:MAG TPA: helix-turn-helix domain-containing protein [Gammaproteobacteria bacterium]|nr:helix-turn-helix domain-containing protein [Gammaproteobacteria bacterium]